MPAAEPCQTQQANAKQQQRRRQRDSAIIAGILLHAAFIQWSLRTTLVYKVLLLAAGNAIFTTSARFTALTILSAFTTLAIFPTFTISLALCAGRKLIFISNNGCERWRVLGVLVEQLVRDNLRVKPSGAIAIRSTLRVARDR